MTQHKAVDERTRSTLIRLKEAEEERLRDEEEVRERVQQKAVETALRDKERARETGEREKMARHDEDIGESQKETTLCPLLMANISSIITDASVLCPPFMIDGTPFESVDDTICASYIRKNVLAYARTAVPSCRHNNSGGPLRNARNGTIAESR